MGKDRRKSTTGCLAAAFILGCYLVQMADCLRLTKSERLSARKQSDVTSKIGVQEGSIVFGEDFEKELQDTDGIKKASSNASVEDESNYQADFAGWTKPEIDDPYKEKWNRMATSLHCFKDYMKFRSLGPGASQLSVDQGNEPPMPLSMVPSKCGYKMQGNPMAFVMMVPYDGCNMIQQGDKYRLPLRWHGNRVSLLCPKRLQKYQWLQDLRVPQNHQLLQDPQEPQVPQEPQYPQGPQYPEVPQPPQYPQEPQYPEVPQPPQWPQYLQWPQPPQEPQYPQVPQPPQWPQYPQVPQPPQYSQEPQYPQVPQSLQWPQYLQWPQPPQGPQYPQVSQYVMLPWYLQKPQDSQDPQLLNDPQLPQNPQMPKDPQMPLYPQMPQYSLPPLPWYLQKPKEPSVTQAPQEMQESVYSDPLLAYLFSLAAAQASNSQNPSFPQQFSYPVPIATRPPTTSAPTVASISQGPFDSYFPWLFGYQFPNMPPFFPPIPQYPNPTPAYPNPTPVYPSPTPGNQVTPTPQYPDVKTTAPPTTTQTPTAYPVQFYPPEYLPFLPNGKNIPSWAFSFQD
nr:uncharacterized protein LOC107383996 [Nothobranchius furzeri]